MKFARIPLDKALDVAFPPTCLSCRAPIAEMGRLVCLCPLCWKEVRFIEKPHCERLGLPFSYAIGEGVISPEVIEREPIFSRARGVVVFEEGPARKLIHSLKYGDRMELAKPIGAWMARAGAEILAEADVLVPIPLHRRRMWYRQFNQAIILARAIAKHYQKPVEVDLLERVRYTRPQVGLSRRARLLNMQDAFRCSPKAFVQDRRVVLVDDVLTSGATANAAAQTLLNAGASQVDVLVFGLAQKAELTF